MPELAARTGSQHWRRPRHVLRDEGDEIAISFGIPPRWARDWTDEEIETVWAEVERRWKPFLALCITS